jgi:hypothetical protein
VAVGQVGAHRPVQGITVNGLKYAPDRGRRRGAPPAEQMTADTDDRQQRVRGTLAPLGELLDAPAPDRAAQAHTSRIAVSEYHRPSRERGPGTESK